MIAALFPYARRLRRGEYAVRLLLGLLLSAPLLWWRWQVVRAGHPTEALLFLAALIVLLVIIQAQTIARLRDADASMLFSVLVYVPYLNLAFALALLLLPSRAALPSPTGTSPGPVA